MTTQDIIDHLKAGRPVTAKVVKEIVGELERKLTMQSDLDLQGYEHMRDELRELRGKLAESDRRVKALEEALQKARDVSSAALARVDKLRAENKALEAACQK